MKVAGLFMVLCLLSTRVEAQWMSHGSPPFNIQTATQGATFHPFSYGYRPHMLVVWDPSLVAAPIKINVVGVTVTLVVKELLVFHPPGWNGTWTNPYGGTVTDIGTRLVSVANWPGTYRVWQWGGGNYDYFRNLNITLTPPGEAGVDYGTFAGPCCYGYIPKPVLCAMLVEMQ